MRNMLPVTEVDASENCVGSTVGEVDITRESERKVRGTWRESEGKVKGKEGEKEERVKGK